tara:strand:+ start:579 stop:830 length:252 start_codon:yes stop_codon:yes gene_type:complete
VSPKKLKDAQVGQLGHLNFLVFHFGDTLIIFLPPRLVVAAFWQRLAIVERNIFVIQVTQKGQIPKTNSREVFIDMYQWVIANY